MFSIELIFECDRCHKVERVQPPQKYAPGGCPPTVRSHLHLPEGWQDRARPESVRMEPGSEAFPYYENVCPECTRSYI